MALSDSEKIDFIGIAPDGFCVLTVADDLNWDDPENHVEQLKAKLNTYVHFIRSGEIEKSYPAGDGSDRKILVALRAHPPQSGLEFLTEAKEKITALGIEFSWQVFHAG
ncbi:MAG: hypothetical protein ACI9BW_004173 [Gammaproteobacteria bacterium]|jgi:hypothetical protein